MEEPKPRSPRAGGTVPTQPRGIEQIIKAAIDRGASDLHIKAGDVFRARIDGKLVPLTKQRLTPEQTKDRKSTRLNSSHLVISYAVFCLKKKKKYTHTQSLQLTHCD